MIVHLQLPLIHVDGTLSRSVNLKMGSQPAIGWARLAAGLAEQGSVLDSGRPVRADHVSDAMRWVGECLAKSELPD